MMPRYVWDGHRWVDAAVARAMAGHHEHGPAVHRDFEAPLLCHADGKMHGSRSTYDAAVRAAGCEIIGKSEARRMAATPYRGTPALEPVGATLRRIINGG